MGLEKSEVKPDLVEISLSSLGSSDIVCKGKPSRSWLDEFDLLFKVGDRLGSFLNLENQSSTFLSLPLGPSDESKRVLFLA